MNFHDQERSGVVTPPRSEGSGSMDTQMLRRAQHDRVWLVHFIVISHVNTNQKNAELIYYIIAFFAIL
jgi:hypothetical protein